MSWDLVPVRECGICERLLWTDSFTDARDASICSECWKDHDRMTAEVEGSGDDA